MSSAQDAVDIVVVGAGLAGSTVALRAAELGLSVLLLEKGREERYLCNTRMSGGVFHIAMNEVKAPPERLAQVIATATGDAADPELARTMANGAGTLVDWLRAQGGQFIRGPAVWQSHILAPPRPIAAGVDWMGRGPDVLLRRMADKLAGLGARRILGAEATALVMSDGRCTGVTATVDGRALTFQARAVVLADGGFQADLDRVRAHIAPAAEKLKQRGAATGTGAGIRMAEAVGAATIGLDRFYGHLLCRDAMTSDKVWPYPELDALATAGIVVDSTGRRVADEGIGGVPLANQLATSPDPLGLTVIFDQKIWEGPGRSARIPANPTLERAGGTIHKAPTLEALSALTGHAPAVLAETVQAYNGAVAAGTTPALHPPRTATVPPQPILTAPFFAIPLCIGLTYTMGGLAVDGDGRVRATTGGTIPGLYAAGSTTGGLEGGPRATYLGGLVKAGTQGLAAAAHIYSTLKT